MWLKHKAPPWESIEWDNFLMWHINVPSTKSINGELLFLLHFLPHYGVLDDWESFPFFVFLYYIHLSMVMGSRYLLDGININVLIKDSSHRILRHVHPLNIDRCIWLKELYKISQYPLMLPSRGRESRGESERMIKYTLMDKRQHGMSKYIFIFLLVCTRVKTNGIALPLR